MKIIKIPNEFLKILFIIIDKYRYISFQLKLLFSFNNYEYMTLKIMVHKAKEGGF